MFCSIPETFSCVTPPPVAKQVAPKHAPPPPVFTSSPISPHPSIRAPSQSLLTPSDRVSLHHMLRIAARHNPTDRSLPSRFAVVGNSSYVPNRSVIVEWMAEVCTSFEFQPTTLHLAVRYMDWTFANLCLTKNTWQLCAASAIFLASKCEEAANLIPVMSDLRYVCDNAFTDHHLRRMEFAMLQCLQWDLVVKTPVHFLNLFLNAVRRRLTNDHQESHCSSPSMATFMLEDKDEEPHDDDDDDDDSIMSDTPDCTCSGDDCNCLMDRLSVVTDDEEMISAENSQSSMSNRQTFITPSEPPSCNAVQRVAVCLLDLSLYDVSMRANYAPNVIAAAALSIAAQISADSVLSPCDVPSYTSVSESDMLDCRQVLLHLFREA